MKIITDKNYIYLLRGTTEELSCCRVPCQDASIWIRSTQKLHRSTPKKKCPHPDTTYTHIVLGATKRYTFITFYITIFSIPYTSTRGTKTPRPPHEGLHKKPLPSSIYYLFAFSSAAIFTFIWYIWITCANCSLFCRMVDSNCPVRSDKNFTLRLKNPSASLQLRST